MKKYLIVLIVLIAGTNAARTQVYIQTTLPTVGLVQKNQLWNLVLVNGNTTPVEGKLDLVLRDRQTGMELMTATTTRITLPKGSISVNVNNLSPVQYNYLGLEAGNSLNGLLPSGSYIACYSFTKIAGDKADQLNEECASFDIEPLSPPMLIFPGDSSALETAPAQFTWTPPTSAGMVSRLQYEILITEIKPGQKANEALQDNMSFYNAANVPANYLTYPATLPAFEKDKWYGWQVVARDGKNYAGKSEVWVFKVKQVSAIEKIINGTPYIKMNPGTPETGIAPNGVLKISCYSSSEDSKAKLLLYNVSGGNEHAEASIPVNLKPGENQLQLNIKKHIRLSEQDTYRAEILYSNGEKNSLLFRVKFFEEK